MPATPDPRVTCDTCGTYTGVDSHCCGRCATDSNTPGGFARIDARRQTNGLPPIDREEKVNTDGRDE